MLNVNINNFVPKPGKSAFTETFIGTSLEQEYKQEIERIENKINVLGINSNTKIDVTEWDIDGLGETTTLTLTPTKYKHIVEKHGGFPITDLYITAEEFDEGLFFYQGEHDSQDTSEVIIVVKNIGNNHFSLVAKRNNGFATTAFFEVHQGSYEESNYYQKKKAKATLVF